MQLVIKRIIGENNGKKNVTPTVPNPIKLFEHAAWKNTSLPFLLTTLRRLIGSQLLSLLIYFLLLLIP